MSEEIVKIPSGKVQFETEEGVKFSVPIISTAREFRELAEKAQADGVAHHVYLEQICAIMKERHSVDLSIEEADWLKDQLETEWAKKKQKQAAATRDTLNSVYSMASTVSNSPNSN